MTLVLLLVLAGVAIGGNGPAYQQWLEDRRARYDAPRAIVHYLPSSCCRPGEPACPDPEHCAICLASRVPVT